MALIPITAQPITDAAGLKAVLDKAGAYRPAQWVADLEETRRQYDGEVRPHVMRETNRRYPATASRMPVAAYQWVAMVAWKASTAYDTTTVRKPLGAAGPLPPDDPAAVAFAALCRMARLDVVMPEFDRVRKLAKSAILHVRSDSVGGMARGKPPKTVVDVIWPQDCFVVPHPQAPTDLQAALRFVRRTGDAAGSSTSYEDWHRDYVIDEAGRVVRLGEWRCDDIVVSRRQTSNFLGMTRTDEEVTRTPRWAPYPLPTLPFFVAHKGIPAGAPFMPFAGGVKDVANMVNASLTSENHTIDMVAAPILALTANRQVPRTMAVGPGALFTLAQGETLDSVTQTADLPGIRASNEAALDMLALTERQPSGAFTGRDAVESGIALKVKSIPAEKDRRDDKNQLGPFEEEEFLPGLVEVHDYFTRAGIGARVVGYSVTFPDPPDFETKAERQTRLGEAVELGWVSAARAAVEADYYATEAEADAVITKLAADRRAAMTPGLAAGAARSESSARDVDDDDSLDDSRDDDLDGDGDGNV